MTEMPFPVVVENQAGLGNITDVSKWLSVESASLKEDLSRSGAVLFRGFPVGSADDFDAFSAAFNYGDFSYRDSLSNAVRINHTPRVFTANEAPPHVEIFLHHEMAQTPVSPEKIFLCCLSAAESGGETPVCRSDLLFAAYQDKHPQWAGSFEKLGLKYRMQMPGVDDAASGQGRSWRSTLSVDSPADAETKLARLGYSWQWLDDESLETWTPVLPAVKQLPDGSKSLYNQVIAAHLGWDNPEAALTFGNDQKIPSEALRALVEMSVEHTVPLRWRDGDVALVDNHRVMHGRYPYEGARKRIVLVCLARDESE